MRSTSKFMLPVILSVILATTLSLHPTPRAETVVYSDQVWDFGHVGIDFKVYHTYWIANNGSEPVSITDVDVSCECSRVMKSDSAILPGDTVYFKLSFETKNYYGAMNRSFTVMMDSESLPQLQFHYLATVGQWFYGIKPEPISVFFLPAHKSRTIRISNEYFDDIELNVMEKADTTFVAEVKTDKAEKGESVEVEIKPAANLGGGTYRTNVTLAVMTSASEKPAIITVPVKIVRY